MENKKLDKKVREMAEEILERDKDIFVALAGIDVDPEEILGEGKDVFITVDGTETKLPDEVPELRIKHEGTDS